MKDTLNQFVANVNGQFIEVSDASNRYQCMDLAYLWVFCLGFPKATIQNLYAYEAYTKPKDITLKHFDLIPNTPDAIPQDGDIVVWSNKLGIAGHIGIALGGGTTSKFRVFEQNNPIGTNAHLQERPYTNVLGWLRPKVKVTGITDQTVIPSITDENGKPMEVQRIRGLLTDIVSANKELSKKLDDASETNKSWQKFLDEVWGILSPIGKEKNTQNVIGELQGLITSEDQCEKELKNAEKWHTRYSSFFSEVSKTISYSGEDETGLYNALQKLVASQNSGENPIPPIPEPEIPPTPPVKPLFWRIVFAIQEFFRNVKDSFSK